VRRTMHVLEGAPLVTPVQHMLQGLQQGISQVCLSVPAACTLATSNFNRHYSDTGVPSMQHVLFGAVHLLLVIYCRYVFSLILARCCTPAARHILQVCVFAHSCTSTPIVGGANCRQSCRQFVAPPPHPTYVYVRLRDVAMTDIRGCVNVYDDGDVRYITVGSTSATPHPSSYYMPM
jgi:hypothetical protein